MVWCKPKCSVCGSSKELRYIPKFNGHYCEKCITKNPGLFAVKVYEPIVLTGRRITHNHRGVILKIEDF